MGEIYLLDTLGQPDPLPYNAVHWNGSQWEVKRISVLHNGDLITPSLYGIFAFSNTDIWLSSGVPIHGDGNNWTQYHLFDMGILGQDDGYLTKIWGIFPDDIYFVGTLGTIVHYQNGHWSKIEGGTDLNINDIYGAFNTKTEKYEILAPAANVLESLDRDLLKIDGDAVTHISTLPLEGTLSSLWFIPNRRYYICGGGIYQKKSLNDSLWGNGPFEFTQYYSYRIRGVGYNDIALTGGVGELLHYNGFGWQSYIEQTRLPYGNYYGLDFKDNVIIAVGENNPQAVITVGRRIN